MLFLPTVETFHAQPRLYETLRAIIKAINSLGRQLGVDPVPSPQTNPDREVSSITVFTGGNLPADGNDGETLAFRKDTPTGVAWEGPHENYMFVAGVF